MKKTFRSEADVKAAVKDCLKAMRAWYFMPSMNGYGRAGVPDIIGVLNGTMFAAETKFSGNKPTPAQKCELAAITRSGGVAMLINENNLDTLADIMSDVELGLLPRARALAVATLKEYGVEV